MTKLSIAVLLAALCCIIANGQDFDGGFGIFMQQEDNNEYAAPQLSAQEEAIQLIQDHPESPTGWVELGESMGYDESETVTIDGVDYTATGCYLKAIDIEPEYARVWKDLAFRIDYGSSIDFKGKQMTRLDCFTKSLEQDPTDTQSWISIGDELPGYETALIDGKPYTREDCYLQAVTRSPEMSDAWVNLGLVMTLDGKVEALGTVYTRLGCFIKALQLEVDSHYLWERLGDELCREEQLIKMGESQPDPDGNPPSALINEVKHTCRSSYTEAIRLNAESAEAWRGIAESLAEDESVLLTVDGQETSFTKADCMSKVNALSEPIVE